MENRKSCPIEDALFQIEASAKTNRNLVNILNILQRIISNLLSHSNGRPCQSSGKENQFFINEISRWEEVRHFLEIIGLKEGDSYEDGICDEETKCLEAALKIVKQHLHNLRMALFEDKSIFEAFKEKPYSRNQRPLGSADTQSEKTFEFKCRSSKLQEMLSRHLKQERIDDAFCNWKKDDVSDSSFNSEGYFCQTSQNKDKKKRKCIFEDMFDRHDFNNNRKGCAFYPYLKLG